MESHKIEVLLKRYFEAKTSLEEEAVLKRYFNSDQVAPELLAYSPMFQSLGKSAEDRFTGTVVLPKKSMLRPWMGAAAAIALLTSTVLGYQYGQRKAAEEAEARIAYQETKKAMMLLAENLNRGTEKLTYLNEFEQTKAKIYNDEN